MRLQLVHSFRFVFVIIIPLLLNSCLPTEDDLNLNIHPFDEAYDKPCGFVESVEYEDFVTNPFGIEGVKVFIRYRINHEVVTDIENRIDTIPPNSANLTFRGTATIRDENGDLLELFPQSFASVRYRNFDDADIFEGDITYFPDRIGDATEFCYNFYFQWGSGDQAVRTNDRDNGCITLR